MAEDKDSHGLTPGEIHFLIDVLKNTRNVPDADFDKVAKNQGLVRSKGARDKYVKIAVKHGFGNQGVGSPKQAGAGADSPNKVMKKKAAPRTKKTAKEAESIKVEAERRSLAATVKSASDSGT
ncbi:hypothetical protein IMZ48_09020 [Candidatus Bathyarchaeota archaeon]|nr:hypothetical protein [Candidatus Bathyarchaeota archaeon]